MSLQARLRARLGTLELDVEINCEAGPSVIIGPNGAGKTTLLRLLAGARRPDAGRIVVGQRVLFDAAEGVDVPPEARRVGYVPQGYGLFPHLSVFDNVAFGLHGVAGLARDDRNHRAHTALGELGAEHLASRMPEALSGGEAQRVALARALVTDPALLLLDEPLAALDAAARRSMRGFLAEHLRGRDCPCLVVTHDVRDVLALDAPVCVVEAGRVVQRGRSAALGAAPATAYVTEFFDAGHTGG